MMGRKDETNFAARIGMAKTKYDVRSYPSKSSPIQQ